MFVRQPDLPKALLKGTVVGWAHRLSWESSTSRQDEQDWHDEESSRNPVHHVDPVKTCLTDDRRRTVICAFGVPRHGRLHAVEFLFPQLPVCKSRQ